MPFIVKCETAISSDGLFRVYNFVSRIYLDRVPRKYRKAWRGTAGRQVRTLTGSSLSPLCLVGDLKQAKLDLLTSVTPAT